jgi:hypothetical protein
MKLFTAQLLLKTPFSNTLKYMFFLQCERPRFTPIQNLENYGFVYFNLYILGQQTGRQKILN